jgi:hypothetical protein
MGDAFDLPMWVLGRPALLNRWQQDLSNQAVQPLKVHQTALDAYLGWCNGKRPTQLKSPPLSPTPRAEAPTEHFFFEGIAAGLPSTWVEAGTVSTKAAVKADDAKASVELWNSRITLVLGGTSEALEVIRNGMMNWWRRSVFRSYIRHLTTEFGPDWMLKLNAARINSQSAPPAPKQARFEV